MTVVWTQNVFCPDRFQHKNMGGNFDQLHVKKCLQNPELKHIMIEDFEFLKISGKVP